MKSEKLTSKEVFNYRFLFFHQRKSDNRLFLLIFKTKKMKTEKQPLSRCFFFFLIFPVQNINPIIHKHTRRVRKSLYSLSQQQLVPTLTPLSVLPSLCGGGLSLSDQLPSQLASSILQLGAPPSLLAYHHAASLLNMTLSQFSHADFFVHPSTFTSSPWFTRSHRHFYVLAFETILSNEGWSALEKCITMAPCF